MTNRWRSNAEVAAYLQVSRHTLLRVRLATPPNIKRPWTLIGTGRQLRWAGLDAVDRWWREVNEWLQSKSAGTAGASDGETRTEVPARVDVRPPEAPKSSKPKSKKPSQKVVGGSLPPLSTYLRSSA